MTEQETAAPTPFQERFGISTLQNFDLNYIGAPALAALGALRTGAGVVTLLSYPEVCEACAAKLFEIVYLPLSEPESWAKAALSKAEDYQAAVIGPGLGRSKEAMLFAIEMWQKWPKKLLVDGDGLYALSVVREILKARDDAVINPHESEAARLLNLNSQDVRADRAESVKKLADMFGCAVLKGNKTLVAKDGELEQINFGGAELSVPGSGDVLSGCIGAYLANGLNNFDAAVLGASIHGMAGDILRETCGVDGVLASEIADNLRLAIKNLRDLKDE
ncbi:MAG: NAD(P)H-hydrate dehydratase [Synergistaceae bacterium]|nr:NAD(P)H-hydrate dehydratase [Synergistaceae bacterium]